MSDDYIPYSDEWRKEMRRRNKEQSRAVRVRVANCYDCKSYYTTPKTIVCDNLRCENARNWGRAERAVAEIKRLRASADYWQRMAEEALDELKKITGGE